MCAGLTEGVADLRGVSEASHGSNAQQAQRPIDLGQVDLALHMLPSVHHLQQVSFRSVFRAYAQGQFLSIRNIRALFDAPLPYKEPSAPHCPG